MSYKMLTTGRDNARANPHTAAFSRGFDRYKPEKEQQIRAATVKKDRILEQLMGIFRKNEWDNEDTANALFLTDIIPAPDDCAFSICESLPFYWDIEKAVEKIRFSKKYIERFSMVLGELQQELLDSSDIRISDHWVVAEKSGIFLSALVNLSKDYAGHGPLILTARTSDRVIHTSHLPCPPSLLGYQNKKDLYVDGPVGLGLGAEMDSGRLLVDCGNDPDSSEVLTVGPRLRGGALFLRAMFVREIGSAMENGIISINARQITGSIGEHATGGTIYLQGDISQAKISEDCKARVYHNDVLIHGDGK